MADLRPIETIIRQYEEMLLQPHIRRSAQMLSDLIADEYIEFGRSGRVYDKQQIIESLPNENPVPHMLSLFKTTPLTPEIILATYHSTYWQPDEKPAHSWRCSIWKLIDGRWQMIFHQGTPTEDSG